MYCSRLRKWETNNMPRRCGISSFGFSGTNSHIILEEAPPIRVQNQEMNDHLQVLTLSARSKDVLHTIAANYREFLNTTSIPSLLDLCFTCNTGRNHFGYRLAIILKD